MNIPLFDPGAEYLSMKGEIDEAVASVLSSGRYVLGEQVGSLEREIAAFIGSDQAVGVASGTDALVLALIACGVGAGDEVVIPAFSFVATAEAVLRAGATPVFADIHPDSGCLDPASFEEACSSETRAVIPVHLYGHPADLTSIGDIAGVRGIKVVEDNAQGLGALYNGHRAGGSGDAGCMSFFPTKTVGGFGDGGMVATSDPAVADAVRALRAHGSSTAGYRRFPGFNSRLDEIQAAALRVKLRHAQEAHERRRALAARLSEHLSPTGAVLPGDLEGCEHTFGLYVIRVPDRDRVRERVEAAGVACGVYYPTPLPNLGPFGEAAPGSFPVAERFASEVLAIPLYAAMSDDQLDTVGRTVSEALS